MRDIHAVIFDMDGVLIDNKEIHRKAWVEFCKRFHCPITGADFDRIGFGKTNKAYLRHFLNKKITDQEAEKLGEKKEAIYRALIEKEIQPLRGLLPLLNRIKNHLQLKVAVASSAPCSNIDFVLDKLGIRHHFDVITDASQVKEGKPHPSIYQRTAELLEVAPDHCLVFEDSLFGIEAADRAGMHVIALSTSHTAGELQNQPCKKIIQDFTGLTEQEVNNWAGSKQ
jgi:beta-phosphoglucomutase family hydrolase